MDRKQMAAQIREEANRLLTAAAVLDGNESTYVGPGEKRRTGARKMSAATRKALSRAQKERWKKVKAEANAKKGTTK